VIEGTVTRQGVPTISLKVAGKSYRAIIDTGFNGGLELPEKLRARVHPELLGEAKSLLAGGVVITENIYSVRFPFDGEIVKAEATFVSGSEILIGTALMSQHRLEVDFVARTLRIEKA